MAKARRRVRPKLSPKQQVLAVALRVACAAVAAVALSRSGSRKRGEAGGAAVAGAEVPLALQTAGERLSIRPATGGSECDEVKLLWGSSLSCDDFLRRHWETAPLLSEPGAAFASSLLTLPDIPTMLGMWPFKFYKNHGTALLQQPASGFKPDPRWKKGQPVPTDIVATAVREERTLVIHNLEVYWPPIGRFVRRVAKFFQLYTQVNLYLSPSGLPIATSPHQDAHSVFIVQIHGSKQWSVHAPNTRWTLKAKQRGKRGEVLTPGDATWMGPSVLNTTLTPGSVLYIPRAFFHNTATVVAEACDAPDGVSTAGVVPEGYAEPSAALTISITTEDVFCTWLFLLGEALGKSRTAGESTPGGPTEADAALATALRRTAVREPGDALGAALRESLPRALLAPADVATWTRFSNASAAWSRWREHASTLLRDVAAAEGLAPPQRLAPSLAPGDELAANLDAVLRRKHAPLANKVRQLSAMLDAMDGASDEFFDDDDGDGANCAAWASAGECEKNPEYMHRECAASCGVAHPPPDSQSGDSEGRAAVPRRLPNITRIFLLEKADRSYRPADQVWHKADTW